MVYQTIDQAPRNYRAQTPPCSCWKSRLPERAREQNNIILLVPKKERKKKKQGIKWLSQKECSMIENMSILEPILQLREKLAKYGSHTYDQTLQTVTTTNLPTGNTPWTHDQIHALVLFGRILVCTSRECTRESANSKQCRQMCAGFLFYSYRYRHHDRVATFNPPPLQCKIREVQRKEAFVLPTSLFK